MLLSKAIDGFIIFIRSENYSTVTIKYYKHLLERLNKNFGEIELNDITEERLRDYIQKLKDSGLSLSSVQVHWKVMRSFYNWAAENLQIQRPDKNISAPKFVNSEIIPYTKDEVSHLLKNAKSKRNIALIYVLLDTGLRSSEMCRMTIRDLNFENASLQVRAWQTGKKSRSRVVFMGKTCQRALWSYIATRDDTEDPGSPLIATKDGRFLNRTGVKNILARIAEKAEVQKCGAHRFRHTFAIEYLRNGGDIFTLQKLLGHASLEMVRRYLRIAESDLTTAHRRASPADRWKL